MSVLITDKDLLDKIAFVEGKAWVHDQDRALRYNELSYSVHEAIQRQTKVIYGCGGLDRYFVRNDGRVVFSKHHGNPATQKLAESIGFDIE